MTSDSDIASYLINLDRSPDRLSSAATQLDRTGLRGQRIRAVDGQELGDVNASCCDAQAFARNVGRSVSASEIALCLSHISHGSGRSPRFIIRLLFTTRVIQRHANKRWRISRRVGHAHNKNRPAPESVGFRASGFVLNPALRINHSNTIGRRCGKLCSA